MLTLIINNGKGTEQFEGTMEELYKVMARYRHLKGSWELKDVRQPLVVSEAIYAANSVHAPERNYIESF